jgi:hypothetical protein
MNKLEDQGTDVQVDDPLEGVKPTEIPVDKGQADQLNPMQFRKPTDAEAAWADPRTPRSFRQKVRIVCPDGNLAEGNITTEDGVAISNVARFFLDARTSFVEGGDNTVKGVIVQYHPEIGQFVYTSAEVLLGQPLVDPAEADAGPTVPDLSNVLYEEPIMTSERREPPSCRRQAWEKNAAGYDTFRPGGHRKNYGRRPGDGDPR